MQYISGQYIHTLYIFLFWYKVSDFALIHAGVYGIWFGATYQKTTFAKLTRRDLRIWLLTVEASLKTKAHLPSVCLLSVQCPIAGGSVPAVTVWDSPARDHTEKDKKKKKETQYWGMSQVPISTDLCKKNRPEHRKDIQKCQSQDKSGELPSARFISAMSDGRTDSGNGRRVGRSRRADGAGQVDFDGSRAFAKARRHRTLPRLDCYLLTITSLIIKHYAYRLVNNGKRFVELSSMLWVVSKALHIITHLL